MIKYKKYDMSFNFFLIFNCAAARAYFNTKEDVIFINNSKEKQI